MSIRTRSDRYVLVYKQGVKVMSIKEFDLFGNEIIKDVLLRDKFIEPPFSILDSKTGNWQRRKKEWISRGLKSEVGRDSVVINMGTEKKEKNSAAYVSVFDPALCEVLYNWFCPELGNILDPFAGGSVRGIVANFLGFKYTGIDIRKEQIDSNRDQALDILPVNNQPQWYVGDSNEVLNDYKKEVDFVFSCPPYADLEVYSDLEGDISNKPYDEFLSLYREIIKKSCDKLKIGGYACFVVGEVRDKKGNYIGFVPDTIRAFIDAGMNFYNEGILLNSIASASMRAGGNMKSKKLVKVHQNILVFRK
jgi:DNA modification methylase